MDNAGENIYIENAKGSDMVLCEMGTIVEYTAPYTPQQNGKVEHAFLTLFGRARTACNGAKLPVELRKKLRDTTYTRTRDKISLQSIIWKKCALRR